MNTDPRASMNWILKKWYLNSSGLLLLLSVFVNSVNGQDDLRSIFEQGNVSYQEGRYDEAIESYNEILLQGYVHADVYYNLGCAYLKEDRLGLAILNFERALELKPLNRAFKHNLKLAQDLTEDDFSVIQGFFVARWLENLTRLISSNAWALLSVLFFMLAVVSILVWLLSKNVNLKKPTFIAGMTFLFLFTGSVVFGRWKSNLEQENPLAIILQSEIPLLIAPDHSSKEVLRIHEGLKVKIVDQIGDWYKIELSNKEVGWVLRSSLERV